MLVVVEFRGRVDVCSLFYSFNYCAYLRILEKSRILIFHHRENSICREHLLVVLTQHTYPSSCNSTSIYLLGITLPQCMPSYSKFQSRCPLLP